MENTDTSKCEHGVSWSMECLGCGPSNHEAVSPAACAAQALNQIPIVASPAPASEAGPQDELQKLRQAIGWICDACDAAYNEDSSNKRIHEIFNAAARAAGLTRRLPDEYQRFDETSIG